MPEQMQCPNRKFQNFSHLAFHYFAYFAHFLIDLLDQLTTVSLAQLKAKNCPKNIHSYCLISKFNKLSTLSP